MEDGVLQHRWCVVASSSSSRRRRRRVGRSPGRPVGRALGIAASVVCPARVCAVSPPSFPSRACPSASGAKFRLPTLPPRGLVWALGVSQCGFEAHRGPRHGQAPLGLLSWASHGAPPRRTRLSEGAPSSRAARCSVGAVPPAAASDILGGLFFLGLSLYPRLPPAL